MSDNRNYPELIKCLLSLDNEEEANLFLEDLCTIKELQAMEQRINAAKMLLEGKTFIEIIESTKISSATLARINHCIKYGKGGYTKVLEK